MSRCAPDSRIPRFVERVLAHGREHYRDFPWRHSTDPYEVLVSEVMLQQTQVARVERYWTQWLAEFPTLETLAAAHLEAVLRVWQGLGYNRRAVALKRLAETLVDAAGSGPVVIPRDDAGLRALPGVGASTSAGVRAFAYGEPAVYLETNVRSVLLHELFADAEGVTDRELLPLLEQAVAQASDYGVEPRTWNFALLDYGAHLKRTRPNPSRRSAHHSRQSPFEGSTRQKRAWLLRAVIESPGLTTEQAATLLALDPSEVGAVLEALATDGFIAAEHDRWQVRQ